MLSYRQYCFFVLTLLCLFGLIEAQYGYNRYASYGRYNNNYYPNQYYGRQQSNWGYNRGGYGSYGNYGNYGVNRGYYAQPAGGGLFSRGPNPQGFFVFCEGKACQGRNFLMG
ncbi:unnamed protein product, partial [Mesorhabditis spiculigera]